MSKAAFKPEAVAAAAEKAQWTAGTLKDEKGKKPAKFVQQEAQTTTTVLGPIAFKAYRMVKVAPHPGHPI